MPSNDRSMSASVLPVKTEQAKYELKWTKKVNEFHLSGSVALNSPDLTPVDCKVWRHAAVSSGMLMNSRSDLLSLDWSGVDHSTLLWMNGESIRVYLRACVRAKGRY